MPAPPLPAPCSSADAARSSAGVVCLGLAALARDLRRLDPPPAYRLSLDSGIEFKNVQRALADPGRARLATWQRLARSLRLRLVAVRCAEDLFWPHDGAIVIGLGTGTDALLPPAHSMSLATCRLSKGLSRREVARRAGVSVDTLVTLERGSGLVERLQRVCAALGLEVFAVLPVGCGSLAELWTERAGPCLQRPAHFAHGRTPDQISASRVSAAAIALSSERLISPAAMPVAEASKRAFAAPSRARVVS